MAEKDIDPAALLIGRELVAAMDEAEMGVRTLARKLAGPGATTKQIEASRRNVTRWRAGVARPTRPNAARLGHALGVEPERFLPSARQAANVLAELERRIAALEARATPRGARRG